MNNLGKYLLVILLFFVVASIGTMAVINSTDNSTSLNLTTIATTMNTHLKINIAPDAPTKWDMISVSGILTLDDNSTLANQSVSFFLGNESIGENFTDTSGVAHIDMDSSLLNAGDYIVSAEYVGNEQYSISYDQLSFSLQENTGENNTTENTTIENNTLENNTLENTTLENNTAQDNIVADQNNDIIHYLKMFKQLMTA
jgi:hypothetical protein